MIIDLILLIVLHFIGDFLLQSDDMAYFKSKNNTWLNIHVCAYSVPFLLYALADGVAFGYEFIIYNYVAHYITDYFSSRATTYLWNKKQRHWFFVVIGLDQTVHLITLFLIYDMLPKG